jgi:2,3-bisphosphoglycerate-dependent phosphoglycerate mutase
MLFYFIRHAQSENNARWAETRSEEGRSEDPELTPLGLRQAEAMADFLAAADPRGGISSNGNAQAGFEFTHIYASLMVRAVNTASIIARRTNLRVHGLVDIHERGGIYLGNQSGGAAECLPGKDRRYFEKHFPDFVLPEDFVESGWWDRRPVEDDETCQIRAKRFLQALLEKHGGTDDRVAVVSHGGFYNDFLWTLLDLAPQNRHWFLMYNTAITRLEFQQRAPENLHVVLTYQNRVEHLTSDLIT